VWQKAYDRIKNILGPREHRPLDEKEKQGPLDKKEEKQFAKDVRKSLAKEVMAKSWELLKRPY
jgi:hypothetical protein